ncbi:MAG: hypothetical protein MJ153_08050 [Clostridia bacterium]|nr:hypothetical protein [Clostridia bacterium]
MKIQKVECPSCGSALDVNEDESLVKCQYCGCNVIVEDARREGYNYEMGKMKARSKSLEELANRIDALMEPLSNHSKVIKERNNLVLKCDSLGATIQKYEKRGKLMSYGYVSCGALLIMLILRLAKASTGSFLVWGIITALSVLAFAFFLICKIDSINADIDRIQKQIADCDKTIEDYSNLKKQNADIDIPKKYCNKKALTYIRDAIKSQRAQTLEYACSLYDDVLRQEETIKLQKEQIRLQKANMEELRRQGEQRYER